FIRGYRHAHDRSPTIREIGGHFGIRSPNGVVCHLKALLQKRLIEQDALISRSIRVVASEPVAPEPLVVAVGSKVILGIGSAVAELTREQAVKLACELMKEARGLRQPS